MISDPNSVSVPRDPTTSRWALVTGSTSGIGRATAVALARDGLSIIVTGRDEARAEETCEAVRAVGGTATPITADLRRAASARELAGRALAAADGRIDVLVNNAGGGSDYQPTELVNQDQYDEAMDVQVRAPFILTSLLAPPMAERGEGVIVNVAAIAAEVGVPGLSHFGAAKAALVSLTRAWTAEFGARGVRVNAVEPGLILVPRAVAILDQFDSFVGQLPARRGGEPEEVAAAIAFLVSPAASYVHGAVLPVDGGKLAALTF